MTEDNFLKEAPCYRARWMGRTMHVFETIGSTNDAAFKYADAGAEEGTVVVADAQTGGRGRQGRVWHSPPGVGLWFSVVLRPGCESSELPLLTQVIAKSIQSAVRVVCGVTPDLKYPNDLLIGGKKVCGILTESSSRGVASGVVVAGVGLNVNAREADFPEALRPAVTSLSLVRGEDIPRSSLFGMILRQFEADYEEWRKGLSSLKKPGGQGKGEMVQS